MRRSIFILAIAVLLSAACIRPKNYHPGRSVFAYECCDGRYFYGDRYYEAYVEFDARGVQFDRQQTERAIQLIHELQNPKGAPRQPVRVFMFVHGWKNNASEDSGNVWGFRRMLNHMAHAIHKKNGDGVPVVGIYLGWPGASWNYAKTLTFWNRESVADAVGAGDLPDVLRRLLRAVKNDDFAGESDAVLIGHSFGGLVLERAMIRLFNEQLDGLRPGQQLRPAADLVLLLNEAGPAQQAEPFIERLLGYEFSAKGKEYPLIASMTSKGDAATKIAFPGGEFLSPSRRATETFKQLDTFGQRSNTPYSLLTTANMQALESHELKPASPDACVQGGDVGFKLGRGPFLCIQRKPNVKGQPRVDNTSSYWVLELPQFIVPDHGTIFRDQVIAIIGAFLEHRGWLSLKDLQHAPAPPAVQPRFLTMSTAAPPPPPQGEQRPVLRKKEER